MTTPRRPALLACLALLAPAAVAQPAAFPAGAWVVQAIGTASQAGAPRADITFTDDGRAHGTTGCNRFTGGYTVDGAALTFGPVAGTRMACEARAMDQERRFHDALAATRGWRFDGQALVLTDADGAAVLRLVRIRAG